MGPAVPTQPWEEASDLFWEVYCREQTLEHLLRMQESDSGTDQGEAALVLREIERIKQERAESLSLIPVLKDKGRASRVPFQPDQEEELDRLHTYLHTAAALALLLKARDGYTDDVRDALNEAWRAALRFFGRELPQLKMTRQSETYIYERSAVATTAVVLGELSRTSFLEGKCGQALHQAALSEQYCSKVSDFPQPMSFTDFRSHRYRHPKYMVGDAGGAFEAFEALTDSGEREDWQQIASDCLLIAETRGPGDDGEEPNFWWQAAGLALAKAEPDRLAAYLKEERRGREYERAEEILGKILLTGASLGELPDKARASLVDAVRTWMWTEGGRLEKVLVELTVAVDALLYAAVWLPLSRWADKHGDARSQGLRHIKKELGEKGHSPSSGHYARILEDRGLVELFKGQAPYSQDIDFVTKELPEALRRLVRLRNPAVHDPRREWTRGEAAPVFNEFFGIGCRGVVPRLASLCEQVRAMERRRSGTSDTLG